MELAIEIFIIVNIAIVAFCIILNLWTLFNHGKKDFYIFITLFFLLLTNIRNTLNTQMMIKLIIVRLILSILALLNKKVELNELWRQQLYYEVPYFFFFIVQISIMFQM